VFGPDGLPGGGDDIAGGVRWIDITDYNPAFPAPFDVPPFDGIDLMTVMIHEIGHALGLDHNNADPNSVMQPNYMGPRRTLSRTDLQNIRRLYGAVPEPGSAVLLALALPWMAFCGTRRRPA
jgi:hypothetical protein